MEHPVDQTDHASSMPLNPHADRLKLFGWGPQSIPRSALRNPAFRAFLCAGKADATAFYNKLWSMGLERHMPRAQGMDDRLVPTIRHFGGADTAASKLPEAICFDLDFSGDAKELEQELEACEKFKVKLRDLEIKAICPDAADATKLFECFATPRGRSIRSITLKFSAAHVDSTHGKQACIRLIECAAATARVDGVRLDLEGIVLFDTPPARAALMKLLARTRLLELVLEPTDLSIAVDLIADSPATALKVLSLLHSTRCRDADWNAKWLDRLNRLLAPQRGLVELTIDLPSAVSEDLSFKKLLGIFVRQHTLTLMKFEGDLDLSRLSHHAIKGCIKRNREHRQATLEYGAEALGLAIFQRYGVIDPGKVVGRHLAPLLHSDGRTALAVLTSTSEVIQAMGIAWKKLEEDHQLLEVIVHTVSSLLDGDYQAFEDTEGATNSDSELELIEAEYGVARLIGCGLHQLNDCFDDHAGPDVLIPHAQVLALIDSTMQSYLTSPADAAVAAASTKPHAAAGRPVAFDAVEIARAWLGSGYLALSQPADARFVTGADLMFFKARELFDEVLGAVAAFVEGTDDAGGKADAHALRATIGVVLCNQVMQPLVRALYTYYMNVTEALNIEQPSGG